MTDVFLVFFLSAQGTTGRSIGGLKSGVLWIEFNRSLVGGDGLLVSALGLVHVA